MRIIFDQVAVLTGWGREWDNGPLSNQLHEVTKLFTSIHWFKLAWSNFTANDFDLLNGNFVSLR